MEVLVVKGTPYQMGYQIGSFYKDILEKEVKVFKDALDNDEKLREKLALIKDKLHYDHADVYEELKGRAEGSCTDVDAFILMNSSELYSVGEQCTTVMIKDNNSECFFSHNEDDSDFTDENTCVIKYVYDDHYEIGYTSCKKLVGCCYGANSYGMVFSSNYLYPPKVNVSNVSRTILSRELYKARSIEEAIEMVRNLRVAAGFSFNVFDLNNKEMVNIEKDLDAIYVTKVADRYARSNHFLCIDGPEYSASSKFRYEKSKELVDLLDNKNLNSEKVRECLTYETDDYFKSIHKASYQKGAQASITVSNMSIDSINRTMCIVDYLGGREYSFDL